MDLLHHVNGTGLRASETYSQLEKIQVLLHSYGGAMEVLLMLPLYWMFIGGTLAYLKGFPKSRKGAAVGFPPHMIIVHVFACLTVVVRYYSRLLFTNGPVPDWIDLALMMLQIATAWYLAKWSRNNNSLYKSSFLIMPFLMTIPVAMAHVTKSPEWHRTTVKCVEWFIHFRLVGVARIKYRMFEPKSIPADAIYHLVSVPVTLALANWSTAIPLYAVLLPLVILLNEWVTKQVPNNQAKRTPLVGLLITAGFCERQTLRPPMADSTHFHAAKADKTQ